MSNIVYIETEGSPKERGTQQGEILNKNVKDAVDTVLSSDIINTIKPGWMSVGMLKFIVGLIARHYIRKPLKKYLPHQLEKIDAISDALGKSMPRNLNYGLHFLETISGHPMTYKNPPIGSCTMIFAVPPATKNGDLIYARNYDFPNVLKEFQMVRLEKPDDRYKNITLTQYPLGCAHMLMNEKGVAIGTNYGRAWKKEPLDYRLGGVTPLMMAQEAIETCSTVDEVVDFITNFPMQNNGTHFGVMDIEGNAVVIESTATRRAIRQIPENGIMAHSNCYVTPELRDANVPDTVVWDIEGMEVPYTKSPKERLRRAREMLKENHGNHSFETFRGILTNHINFGDDNPSDFSVCCHGHSAGTLASTITFPKKGEFWVAKGYPCQTEYEKFTL